MIGRTAPDDTSGHPPLSTTHEPPEDELEPARAFEALFQRAADPGQLGRYAVLGTLGQGGMGTVLRAHDRELDRQVAVKVLTQDLGPLHTARLRREAQAMAKLSHPNVVQVYEVGELEAQTFVVMELVRGPTVEQWLEQDPPPHWRACVELFLQLGAGLAAAHEQGLVHRDFKPGNAIIDDKGRPRVLDFGLARQTGDEDDPPPSPTTPDPKTELEVSLTTTGAVVGTPAYMAPEQMAGLPADARSDQFSFCVSLYEVIHGERPYEGTSMAALMMSTRRGVIRPAPRDRRAPPALRQVLLRGLATDPTRRWPSMGALLEELRRVSAPRRRWWLGLSVGVGLLAVAASLGVQQYLGWAERCTGAQLELVGVWDEEHRHEVETAILGTELGFASSTWERVEQRLDDYAESWATKYTDVCEATRSRDEYDEDELGVRRECMRDRKQALRAAVGVLAKADANVVENAVDLVSSLPGFDRCDDLDALRAAIPPPEDPQVAQEVDAIRNDMRDYTAAQQAGLYASALEGVEPLVQRAEALGYEPLVAELKALRGSLYDHMSRFDEAERDLLEAHELAMEHRQDEVAFDTIANLAWVVTLGRARLTEGLIWSRAAMAHAKRSGDDLDLARGLTGLAIVLEQQGSYEQARQRLEQSLQLKEAALGPNHPQVAAGLHDLANVAGDLEDYERARQYYERALRINEEALGPDHPHVAYALGGLARVFRGQGDHEQAKRHYERALQLEEAALGPDHPNVAMSLTNLAIFLDTQGAHEQAKPYFERSLRIQEAALGPDHPDVAASLNGLAIVLMKEGRPEQAKPYFERALRNWEEGLGPDHPFVANVLVNLALWHRQEGKHELARSQLARALEIFEKTLSPDHSLVAACRIDLALVLIAQGKHELARPQLEQALHALEQTLGPDHPQVPHALAGLVKVAMAEGDFDQARTLAQRALSIREAIPAPLELIAESRMQLARALWSDETQRPRARMLAERARDAYMEGGAGQEQALARAEAWLAEHPPR